MIVKKVSAKLEVHTEFKLVISISEAEAQALIGLLGYDSKAFLKVFYEHLGKHYLKPHEKGIVSLHENLFPQLNYAISEIEKQRNAIKKALEKQ